MGPPPGHGTSKVSRNQDRDTRPCPAGRQRRLPVPQPADGRGWTGGV